MYICICNGYRDAEISEMAQTGIRCARKAFQVLGGSVQCGRCLHVAQNLIDQINGEMQSDVSFASCQAQPAG